jgi:hypothetical protein
VLSVYVARVSVYCCLYVVRVICVLLSLYVALKVNEPGKIHFETFGLLGLFSA